MAGHKNSLTLKLTFVKMEMEDEGWVLVDECGDSSGKN